MQIINLLPRLLLVLKFNFILQQENTIWAACNQFFVARKIANRKKVNWSTPKHQPKHMLEKWFIISGNGVRPSVHRYKTKETDQRVKPLFNWLMLGRGSLYDSVLSDIINTAITLLGNSDLKYYSSYYDELTCSLSQKNIHFYGF